MARVIAYHPASGTFEDCPPLPFPPFTPAVGMADGKLLVLGGMFRTGPREYGYVNHVFALQAPAVRPALERFLAWMASEERTGAPKTTGSPAR